MLFHFAERDLSQIEQCINRANAHPVITYLECMSQLTSLVKREIGCSLDTLKSCDPSRRLVTLRLSVILLHPSCCAAPSPACVDIPPPAAIPASSPDSELSSQSNRQFVDWYAGLATEAGNPVEHLPSTREGDRNTSHSYSRYTGRR